MTSFPSASPSRATLQSVNDFLLTSVPAAEVPMWLKEHQSRQGYILALFDSLAGEWVMKRDIVNFRDDGLAGSVTGSATFKRRDPTFHDAAAEYLYDETGKFTTTTNVVLQATRRWIWRYHSDSSVQNENQTYDDPSTQAPISVHFVKADGETEDYVYNMLTFPPRDEVENASGGLIFKARAEHPCGEDFYVSTYEFDMALGRFEVQHEVNGPNKDYISRTVYTKP